jgi:phosphoribosylanthranilate isomerase
MIGTIETRALTGTAEVIVVLPTAVLSPRVGPTTNDQRRTTNDVLMTWVKICGITNLEDALVAVEAGADAVGFVFYAKSPRNVHPELVRGIASKLPSTTERVGVFVGESVNLRIVHQATLTAVQLHSLRASPSRKTLKDLDGAAERVFLALSAAKLIKGRIGGFKWRKEAKDTLNAIFFDSGTPSQPGGTGKTFDWNKALPVMEAIDQDFKVVIAGGLNPSNVDDVIGLLHPWGVDVSSGVEARPGKKDPDKVRAFIKAVREADKANSRN